MLGRKRMSQRTQPHLVAMGGGGFSMEPNNPLLDNFILSLARRRTPRVGFLCPMDSDNYYFRFYKAFTPRDCRPAHLALFNREVKDLRKFLLEQDVIYVGGGNTANMLAVWRVHGVDKLLREAWRRGAVMCGLSAGMICWFESSCTDSFGPLAALNDGLGIIKGSACPHYDGEAKRRPTYHDLIRRRVLPAGYAADDGAALHFVGAKLAEVVTSRPNARAYRVELRGS